jgi:O-antigen/teichoic acid export membrane protein
VGVIKQQSIKGTIYSYLGVILGFITAGLLFPKYLSTAEIGAINLLLSYSMILGQIGTLGFSGAIIRFFPMFKSLDGKHNGFLFWVMMASILGIAVFYIVFTIIKPWLIQNNEQNSPLFAHYIYLIIPLTIAQLLFNNLESYGNSIHKTAAGVLLKDFGQRVLILIPLLALIFGLLDFQNFIFLYVSAIVLTTLIMAAYLMVIGQFNLGYQPGVMNRKLMGEMTSLSLFGLASGFSALSLQRVDGIVINEYFNEALTGIYATTFYFGTLVIIPYRIINKIAYPIVAEAAIAEDWKKISTVYKKTSLIQTIIGVLLLLGLIVNLENVFRILPEEYEIAYWVIIWIGVGNLIRMSAGVVDGIIGYTPYYRYNTLMVIILFALTVGLIFLFIKPWGISGVAFGTAMAVFIFNILRVAFVYRKFKMFPYNRQHLKVYGIAAICFGISWIIPDLGSLLPDLLIRSAVVTLVFVGLIYIFKVSEDANQVAESFFQKMGIKSK